MTALDKFVRLEASGIWRADPGSQRRDVVLSMGKASLTITDFNNLVLGHWSLPAIARLNPNEKPACFSPGDSSQETLEIADEDMISAIETVRITLEKRRPRPGKIRLIIAVVMACLFAFMMFFWLPNALRNYTAAVVPDPVRSEIGRSILTRLQRITGRQCDESNAQKMLELLRDQIFPQTTPHVMVFASGVETTAHLPGKIFLINKTRIEEAASPEVLAGDLIAEQLRLQQQDPLINLLAQVNLVSTIRLLTTGELPDKVVDRYAEKLLTAPQKDIPTGAVMTRFAALNISSDPYAQAISWAGARPNAAQDQRFVSLLSDSEWITLQGICDR